MAGAIYYPPADRHTQWFGRGHVTMPMRNVKWLIHTTETPGGWPGYDGGGTAPTLTYEPWRHEWRQHFPINGSAMALRDPSSTPVKENRADVVQVEISCYCDPSWYRRYGHAVTDLDDRALDDLGAFALWMHNEWGMALQLVDKPWPAFPASASIGRMSSSAYESFSGILGHEHAPGNYHGDPGALNVAAILGRAKGEEDMSAEDIKHIDRRFDSIERHLAAFRENSRTRDGEALATLAAIQHALDTEPSLPDTRRAVRDIVRASEERIKERLASFDPPEDSPPAA